MPDALPFKEQLRAEYDHKLMNIRQRRKSARRLYRAMKVAKVWPGNPRILDVGCGTGLKLDFLGNNARLRIGCDIRHELYLRARDHMQHVTFVQADASQLPFAEDSFDLVTCLSVIGELPDYKAAITDMTRCIASGGLLCINVTNGPLLKKVYTLIERMGGHIRESWWAYAKASLPIIGSRPERGYDIASLAQWRYIHLTPFLVREELRFLKALPFSMLDVLSRRLSPTLVHIWIKPLDNERNH